MTAASILDSQLAEAKRLDPDTLNRPVREAAQRWARERGRAFSQAWIESRGRWELVLDTGLTRLMLVVLEDGRANIAGRAEVVRTARGMTLLLNRIEREALAARSTGTEGE